MCDWCRPIDETGSSRRELVRSTAGGIVLAAGGHFLPSWLEDEAEARGGAYGGQLGGRRGKDRRGRDEEKRRRHGDRKRDKKRNENKPPGRGLFHDAALTIRNRTAAGVSLGIQFYYRPKTGLDDYDLPVENGHMTLDAGRDHRYAPGGFRICAQMIFLGGSGRSSYFADVRNLAFGFPRGFVNYGIDLNPPSGQFGEPVIPEQGFAEDEPETALSSVGTRIILAREFNSDDFIEFTLTIDG